MPELKRTLSHLCLVSVLMLTACAGQTKPDETLYQRLGGLQGVTTIVDNLLYELGSNEKLIGFFAETDIDRFRSKLIEQLCQVSDGGCEYTGDSMAQAHSTMSLDQSHFDSLVNDLIAAMDAAGTPVTAQNDLLSRLVPMYDEVMHPQRYLETDSPS
ncbi:group I truncated hemoglobin [Reinekea blandensis]|uniref:Protozoan/cyanobacterial globin n=1 Tax=Reinekea blandensis MED297 TaxID=314283 RepID=A4BB88_9GAMM|nr:group 1 truncated hemoglobin [Reinekea blandensis]EAR10701.1 Protozoan/cyanobacterial globin [Reinekea sp. MED297] [Reinekea blandensis MED297]